MPIGYWDVGTMRYTGEIPSRDSGFRGNPQIPAEREISSRQTLKLEGEDVTCYEYWPERHYGPSRPLDSSVTFFSCLGESRFYARFAGEKSEVPTFFKMLRGVGRDLSPIIFGPAGQN